MPNMLAFIVTTKALKPWDVEWALGHFDYMPETDTTWTMPTGGGHIKATFADNDYAKEMPPEWITDMGATSERTNAPSQAHILRGDGIHP
jgi:hypothetical protein